MPRNFVPDAMLEKLIKLVRQNPSVYDTSRLDYRDKIKNAKSIAAVLDWEEKTRRTVNTCLYIAYRTAQRKGL